MAGKGIVMHGTGLQPHLNLSAHYPPRPGWGADKCTLGPQAKLIHLPSFSWGSEVAAARRQGRGGLIWRERRTGEGVRQGGEGRRNRERCYWLCSPYTSHFTVHTHIHALQNNRTHPSPEIVIKTCTHYNTKSQVGN